MFHADGLAGIGGEERSAHGDVVDVAPGNAEAREAFDVESVDGRARREDTAPDFGALRCFGEWELDDEAEAAEKGLVERGLAVGGEDGETAIGLHALEQVADFAVGVAVVAVFDIGALAEERIGFVEEQDGSALFSGVENAA